MGIPAPLGVAASGTPPAGDKANAVAQGTITGVGPTAPFAFLGPANLALWASSTTTLTTTANSSTATVASGTGLAAGVSISGANVPRGTTYGTFSGTSGTLRFPPVTLYGKTTTSAAVITDLASTTGLVGATVTGAGIPAATTVTAILTPAVPPSLNSSGVRGVVSISATPTSAPVNPQRIPFVFAPTNSTVVTGADAAAVFTGPGIVYVGTVQLERSFDGCATWVVCNIGGSGMMAQYSAGTPVSTIFGEPEGQVYYRLNCTAYTSGTINYRLSETGQAALSLSISAPI